LGFDQLNEHFPFRAFQCVEKLLDHVVAILITDQRQRRAFAFLINRSHGGHDFLPFFVRTELNALLDNVAGKFVLREVGKLAGHQRDELATVVICAMFNNMLGDIVAELIDNE